MALLARLAGRRTLVFASSLDATHRLFLLLAAAQSATSGRVVEFSSRGGQACRAAALAAFASGWAAVMVASDVMTRGMDVPGVECVINFDAPVYAKTYVHRCGRTARGGRGGEAYTLLGRAEMRQFKATSLKAAGAVPPPLALRPEELQARHPWLSFRSWFLFRPPSLALAGRRACG